MTATIHSLSAHRAAKRNRRPPDEKDERAAFLELQRRRLRLIASELKTQEDLNEALEAIEGRLSL